MYGELNFNPTLFVAQMKYIIPFAIGCLIALLIWVSYHEHHEKKVNKYENRV